MAESTVAENSVNRAFIWASSSVVAEREREREREEEQGEEEEEEKSC